MPLSVHQLNESYTLLDLSALDETDDANVGGQVPSGAELLLAVDVTTITGSSPTLDLEVEWSGDGATYIGASDTFTQITATGVVIKTIPVKAALWRLVYGIGGTGVVLDFKVVAHGIG